ncbi:hypothetical protein BC628DRAFT_1006353 [Trametes gibbosa]|nr:hypothetical protein BC628DRAFT_1006353 [Trametes gibbosa]
MSADVAHIRDSDVTGACARPNHESSRTRDLSTLAGSPLPRETLRAPRCPSTTEPALSLNVATYTPAREWAQLWVRARGTPRGVPGDSRPASRRGGVGEWGGGRTMDDGRGELGVAIVARVPLAQTNKRPRGVRGSCACPSTTLPKVLPGLSVPAPAPAAQCLAGGVGCRVSDALAVAGWVCVYVCTCVRVRMNNNMLVGIINDMLWDGCGRRATGGRTIARVIDIKGAQQQYTRLDGAETRHHPLADAPAPPPCSCHHRPSRAELARTRGRAS